jgi:hypothetical protein
MLHLEGYSNVEPRSELHHTILGGKTHRDKHLTIDEADIALHPHVSTVVLSANAISRQSSPT